MMQGLMCGTDKASAADNKKSLPTSILYESSGLLGDMEIICRAWLVAPTRACLSLRTIHVTPEPLAYVLHGAALLSGPRQWDLSLSSDLPWTRRRLLKMVEPSRGCGPGSLANPPQAFLSSDQIVYSTPKIFLRLRQPLGTPRGMTKSRLNLLHLL